MRVHVILYNKTEYLDFCLKKVLCPGTVVFKVSGRKSQHSLPKNCVYIFLMFTHLLDFGILEFSEGSQCFSFLDM